MISSILGRQEQDAVVQFGKKMDSVFGHRLVLIKLYGSSVRGERREDSDIDILVLVENLAWEEKRRVWDEATNLNIANDTLLSPLVMTPQEFQTLRERERRIALDIDREGVVL